MGNSENALRANVCHSFTGKGGPAAPASRPTENRYSCGAAAGRTRWGRGRLNVVVERLFLPNVVVSVLSANVRRSCGLVARRGVGELLLLAGRDNKSISALESVRR